MRTREWSWLGVFIIGLIMGIYKSMLDTWTDGIWFYMFALIGLILYLKRRQQRLLGEMHNYYNNKNETGE